MDKQGVKLMKILGVAVLNLDKMDQFKPMLETLGKKVGSWGVMGAVVVLESMNACAIAHTSKSSERNFTWGGEHCL